MPANPPVKLKLARGQVIVELADVLGMARLAGMAVNSFPGPPLQLVGVQTLDGQSERRHGQRPPFPLEGRGQTQRLSRFTHTSPGNLHITRKIDDANRLPLNPPCLRAPQSQTPRAWSQEEGFKSVRVVVHTIGVDQKGDDTTRLEIEGCLVNVGIKLVLKFDGCLDPHQATLSILPGETVSIFG